MSTIENLQRRVDANDAAIAALQRTAGPQAPRAEFIAAKARAEPICQAFGDEEASGPLTGEGLQAYRLRLLAPFLKHSAKYKDSDLSLIGDSAIFDSVEASIYSDAQRSLATRNFPPGVLIPQHMRDATGRTITRYIGHNMAAWQAFTPPPRYARFLTPPIH